MKPRQLIPIDAIVAGLAAQALPLCEKLYANGVRDGHEFRVGSLAGEPGRSMAVHLTGSRAGVWSDFSTGETGDALDLVAQARFAGDKGEALKWARGFLGLDGSNPDALKATIRAVEDRSQHSPTDESKQNRAAAFRIFLSAQEQIGGTPVAAYLAGRKIDLALLGKQPRALRYHPALWNTETQRKYAAMVASIVDHEGSTIAVHRTWLQADPSGNVLKVPGLKEPKKVIGSFKGGAIRLWRGGSMKPLSQASAGETVVLTEGIEDALTVALACPQYRIMAAVSLANMGSLVLPRCVETVIICADNDDGNEQAAKGLERAIRHFVEEGREVKIARSTIGKDFNDMLRADEQ